MESNLDILRKNIKSKSQMKRLWVQMMENHYRRAFMAGHTRHITWENFIFLNPAEEMWAVRKAFMAGHTRHETWESYARRNHPSALH